MKPCKAKLPDGKPCLNQADEEQEYCPFHLADQIRMPKKILAIALPVLGAVVTGVVTVLVKFVANSKRK